MATALDAIPGGTNLVIDTNIFVFGLTGKSSQCKTLLQRCSNEEIFGITLFEVIHEATHVFMMAEARAKGLSASNIARHLASHPDQVKALADYWVNIQNLLKLNIVLLPMEQDVVVGAHVERSSAGLLTNDSVIVSAMREYGISLIATHDSQFDAVAGISVFSPTDVV